MPTYEYECIKKGHHFERFQMMTDPLVRKCPKCGGKVRRLISGGAGILFKGSGFYETDYRSGDYKKKAEADKKPKPDSSAGKKKDKSKNPATDSSPKKQTKS